ncbi:hypothetical protein GWI34_24070 [Actinomadura sp. DSM 109109]|nr:hypothetical protein [Actinomadura lepetitiana]
MTEQASETGNSSTGAEDAGNVMLERLNLWFWFGLVFGILPVIIDFIRAAMSTKGVTLDGILGNGEVLISGAAISGAATGELLFMQSSSPRKIGRLNTFASCLLVCLCNSAAYTQVDPERPDATVATTLILFPLTIITSALCVGMAARK